MPVRQTLPIREVLRGRRINWVDVVVGAAIIALLYIVVRLGQSLSVNFTPGRTPVVISTDISNVPYYAARSLLRMFIALGLSTLLDVFTTFFFTRPLVILLGRSARITEARVIGVARGLAVGSETPA